MLQRIFLGVLVFGGVASAAPLGHTDIVMRILNFLLFMGILWYCTANTFKNILATRRAKISKSLEQLQEERQAAKEQKEQALKALEEAKAQATQIVSNAKQEAYLLTQKFDQQSKATIEKLIKNHQATQEKEDERMQAEAIAEVLGDLFEGAKAELNTPNYMHLIQQKVAQ
ncbi:ATP synthase B chain [Helicobacter heilmannii]|uniref:ATP synthase subunit b n=1 Tax=Helicobacter heilmannii TaxID=35817 RepID=A0A0K2YA24_HELHE|nr:ATP synthase B chain [Helicobacter heilmannii]CCM11670.1 ATP synthase B chain [Helicobacter heilmannii ASB1.4]CRI33810.1 ATP synthase B chain [Helicobacter heilmannii]